MNTFSCGRSLSLNPYKPYRVNVISLRGITVIPFMKNKYKNCLFRTLTQTSFGTLQLLFNYVDNRFKIKSLCDIGEYKEAKRLFASNPANPFGAAALIAASVKQQEGIESALELYRTLISASRPNAYVFSALLSACRKYDKPNEGVKLFQEMQKFAILPSVGCMKSLLALFLETNDVLNAIKLFDQIKQSKLELNNIDCTQLIELFSKANQLHSVLEVLALMDAQKLVPDALTYKKLIKACTKAKNLVEGERIVLHAKQHGMDSNVSVCNTALDMYAKLGNSNKAATIFEALCQQHKANTITWTMMISAYTLNKQPQQAVDVFLEMMKARVAPTDVTFVTVLTAVSALGDLSLGRTVCNYLKDSGITISEQLRTALLAMYWKCNSLSDAHEVLAEMQVSPTLDTISYNAMLHFLVQVEKYKEVEDLFHLMRQKGVKPDEATFVAMMTMYAKRGKPEQVHEIFLQLHSQQKLLNVKTWNVYFGATTEFSQVEKFYSVMQASGVLPDDITYLGLLRCCIEGSNIAFGRALHRRIYSGSSPSLEVQNALLNMYAKCGTVTETEQLFTKMPRKDVITWTILISAYNLVASHRKALDLFPLMIKAEIQPSDVTYACLFTAAGNLPDLATGKQIHSHSLTSSIQLTRGMKNALLQMYFKCGSMDEALDAFQEIRKADPFDLISWNTMLSCYVQQKLGNKAISLFQEMQAEGIKPDAVTYSTLLTAAADTYNLPFGKTIHQAVKSLLPTQEVLGNALLNMYIKCGQMNFATELFTEMRQAKAPMNVITWTVMITGLIDHDKSTVALQYFNDMKKEGTKNVTSCN